MIMINTEKDQNEKSKYFLVKNFLASVMNILHFHKN